MRFEVNIPQNSNPSEVKTLVIEAPNWLLALRDGLKQVGESEQIRNITCDILKSAVHVTEASTGRTFKINELEGSAGDMPEPAIAVPAAPPMGVSGKTEAFTPDADFYEKMQKAAQAAQDKEEPVLELSNVASATSAAHTLIEAEPIGHSINVKPPTSQLPVPPAADDTPFPPVDDDLSFAPPAPVAAPKPAPPAPAPIKNVAPPPPAPVAPPPPKPEPVAPPAPKARPEPPKAKPKKAEPANQLLGGGGKYKPGMTTEILADAFMRAMEIYDYGQDRHAAMKFVLELASSNVSAAGGAVLLTDINSPNQELWFEVVSGDKASQIINFRIPMGQGIVGYCAKEGVSLLVADAQQDHRFESDIMKQLGVQPGSILCVPIQHQKRILGAIQLYNNPNDRPFSQGELSIINYLAHTAGEYLISLI